MGFFDKLKRQFSAEKKQEELMLEKKAKEKEKHLNEIRKLWPQGKKEFLDVLKEIISEKKYENREKLYGIAEKYELTDRFVVESIRESIEPYFESLLKEESISENEYNHFRKLKETLNIEYEQDEIVRVKYILWARENKGYLPEFQSDRIILKKGEKLYLEQRAKLYKYVKQTNRVNFHGPVLNLKIVGGLKYKVGSLGLNKQTTTKLENIDEGYYFITDKRVVFIGDMKNFSYTFDKIMKYGVTDEGLLIQKENLVNPQIVSMDNYEVAMAVFADATKELNN